MVQYIIQTIAFQLFFLIVYDVFLQKETFFNWNRGYLLLTAALSFVLPFIKIEMFKNIVPQQYIITLPEVVIGKQNPILLDEVLIEGANQAPSFSWSWMYLFYFGSAIALVIFVYKLINIFRLIYSNQKHQESNLQIINLDNSRDAFSFFNYIFIGKQLENEERETILKHELVHVKQKHSFDMLFFEILRILFWFNPFIYMYQNRISVIHEFIADAEAVKHNKTQYYQNLLSQVFHAKQVSFINPFFKESLIKKRIVMLQKSKSKQVQLVRYALLIPMVIGMLIYSSCSDTTQESEVTNTSLSKNDSSILENIATLKEAISAKGEMTTEEEKALKTLLMLVSENGLNEPFFQDVVDRAEIPFGVIENVPVFLGCENAEDSRKCFVQSISKHVGANFNSKLGEDLGLKGIQKISVFFKIDSNGNITDAKARAPHEQLEKEAIRVIKMLPRMTAGTQDGKAVTVPYYLPIKFEIKE